MSPAYLAIVAGGLVIAALLLMLASLLDAPALRIVAVVVLLAALVAREIDRWGRQLPVLFAALLLAIAVGYALSRLGG